MNRRGRFAAPRAVALVALVAAFARGSDASPAEPILCDSAAVTALADDKSGGFKILRDDANGALKQPLLSITAKSLVPPSGDKHDYLSIGPYSWPDATKPDGLPWINKDGQVNRDRVKVAPDSDWLGKVSSRVHSMATIYAATHEEKYALGAIAALRGWF